jgi:hypothetical protein
MPSYFGFWTGVKPDNIPEKRSGAIALLDFVTIAE